MSLGESNILRDEIIQVYKNKGLIYKENKYIVLVSFLLSN